MATSIHIETDIPLNRKDYFELLFRNDFDTFLAKELGLKGIREISCVREGNTQIRSVKVMPNVPIPSVAQWYLGQEELFYVDNQHKYYDTYEVIFHITPPVCQDRLFISGKICVHETGANSCKHIIDVSLRVDAWGVGSVFESILSNELQKSYHNTGNAVKKWLELQDRKNKGEVVEELVFVEEELKRAKQELESQSIKKEITPAVTNTAEVEKAFLAQAGGDEQKQSSGWLSGWF